MSTIVRPPRKNRRTLLICLVAGILNSGVLFYVKVLPTLNKINAVTDQANEVLDKTNSVSGWTNAG